MSPYSPEYDQNGNWVRSEVSAAGQLIATYKNDNLGVHFHVADWLGTRRIQTDYAGVLETSFTNAPFGDSLAQYAASGCSSTNGCSTEDVSYNHFTGQDRDFNEFRALTNNYTDFSRSAEDLMKEVYSKYPIFW